MQRTVFLGLSLAFLLTHTAAAADIYIAGTKPYQRPAHAPKITQPAKGQEWYKRALHGVYMPYPSSLGFLEAQGAWYTPMNHPGMTEPYDIRYWHHSW